MQLWPVDTDFDLTEHWKKAKKQPYVLKVKGTEGKCILISKGTTLSPPPTTQPSLETWLLLGYQRSTTKNESRTVLWMSLVAPVRREQFDIGMEQKFSFINIWMWLSLICAPQSYTKQYENQQWIYCTKLHANMSILGGMNVRMDS